MNHIYVLELTQNKFYIGVSTDVNKSYLEHQSGKSLEWTKIHPPIEIAEVILDVDQQQLDLMVKKYMSQRGIDNVRGGSYCQNKLTLAQWERLEIETMEVNNSYLRCGKCGHLVKIGVDRCKCGNYVDYNQGHKRDSKNRRNKNNKIVLKEESKSSICITL